MRDELRTNKIAGAILGTALLILGLRQGAEMLFAPPKEMPAKAGYKIEVQEDSAGGGAEPADVPPDWGTVLPTADVAAGQTISSKCMSCHTFTQGGPNGTGPNLWGVLGRTPGTNPGFAYSAGMTAEGAKIGKWDYAHVYEFLKNPQAYVGGTKMSFVGLKKREDRINLLAWLRQQNSSPPAIPAPDPKAAAAAAAPATATGSAPSPTPASTVAGAATAANAGSAKPTATTGTGPATALNASAVAPTTGAAAAPTATTSTAVGGSTAQIKK